MREIAMVVTLALGMATPTFAGDGSNVRLRSRAMRERAARSLEGAAERIERPACAAVLDEFGDASGRRLRISLETAGVSPGDYLGRIFFYDGLDRGHCRTPGVLAVTEPGSRVVRLCSRFFEQAGHDPALAEATIIHEALHTLGLGENPPSSQEITARVIKGCHRTLVMQALGEVEVVEQGAVEYAYAVRPALEQPTPRLSLRWDQRA